VAPQQGYDEPGIIPYAIRSFCPTSADGLQGNSAVAFVRALGLAQVDLLGFSIGGYVYPELFLAHARLFLDT
jgi:pimeloyl-ACP methyl ester carboxylesterase